ncbi:hydrogenase expression/formation protein HypE [Saccharopolyspora sp. NFXS83]|uniref:hydrogenase expression/formation protein HypE n=1 Tax=Saccharopolyspora sp. NFXS83 TaxID=2993560 RepID=UPI00224AC510|nr:hydrogenase expression/formation protein HypE [Saccharopolyspora sp. NFXS83]MCX2729716.1 hydrogenase expression/formation protein HypE [Saccharopolyspora sp. NFXS83]
MNTENPPCGVEERAPVPDGREFVESVVLEEFPAELTGGVDLAPLDGRIAMTTDSFAASPLFFPGGDLGDLAVNGTVNDLAASGAVPRHLVARLVVEDGFTIGGLRRVARSMGAAATGAGVRITSGGGAVVARGEVDGCRIDTTGVGTFTGARRLGASRARPGDAVLVTGPVGDHGIAVLLRQDSQVAGHVSDTAALHGLLHEVLAAAPGVRVLRNATRGGIAAVLDEISRASGVAVALDEDAVPVRARVRAAAELLDIDPLRVACEGRAVAVVDAAQADVALAAMRAHPLGERAAIIGRIEVG